MEAAGLHEKSSYRNPVQSQNDMFYFSSCVVVFVGDSVD
jgi:hypothetical protein